ncbi:MAG: PrgI family protein [Patescibacteria group bacterium]
MAVQKYIVPQFIEVEDKIIGPITVRQFILLLVGGLIIFLLWQFGGLLALIAGGILDIAVFAGLAFVKINGRPIHFFLLNFIQTMKRPRLRIWNKEAYVSAVHEKKEVEERPMTAKAPKPAITGSRLSDLSLVVNTGGVYQGEELSLGNQK